MYILKDLAKKLLLYFGYELRAIDGNSPTEKGPDFWIWLRKTQNIKTIIDIGAYNGEFAQFLAKYFKASETYAFEPLPSCIPKIESRASKIPNLKIFNLGLSDYAGTEIFYQNNYGPASSLLQVSKQSIEEFPQTNGEQPITINLSRLDDVLDADFLKKEIFIKIDAQGVEDRVIRGGVKVFSSAKFVCIEMSIVPMYDGQPLFEEVHALLVDLGFRFSGIKNQIDSQKTGQPLFVHCLYVKAGS